MPTPIRVKRGTKAQLQAAASANQLQPGEPYLITDEGRLAAGLTVSSFAEFAKLSEIQSSNVITSTMVPGASVNNSTAEVVVAQFELGGANFQPLTQWHLDIGFSAIQNSGANSFGNFFLRFAGTVILSNQNNDNPLVSAANVRAGLAKIKIVALSNTQLAITVLLRLGLGVTIDLIDKGNTWDHTGFAIVTVPSLNTAQLLQATVQSRTAHPSITYSSGFATLEEIKPNTMVAPFFQRGRTIVLENHFLTAAFAPFAGAAISSGSLNAPSAGNILQGLKRLRSSTTANSGYRVILDIDTFIIAGGEKFLGAIITPPVFATTLIRLGFLDATTSVDASDGVYFELNAGVAVGKTANAGTRSNTATNFAAAVNTLYFFSIEIATAAASVQFRIFSATGAQLWTDTLATNIPPANVARSTGGGLIATSSGTTAIDLCHVDYLGFELIAGHPTLVPVG